MPLPAQQPHIPIWVGGKTAVARRRVARYGQGYHSVGSSPEELADEIAAVHAEMEAVGRDPAELVVSMLWGFLRVDSAEQLVDMIGRYAEAGLHHLVGIPWLERIDLAGLSTADLLAARLDNMARFAADVLVPRREGERP